MAFELAYRPVRSISAYVSPPGDHLVAILKAYLDDSGDGDSADESHLTIGGWLADHDSWQRFEPMWDDLMREFGIPYLHMAEFRKENAKFKHLKSDPAQEKEFWKRVNSLILQTVRTSVACTVRMDDLNKFNKKLGLGLDPYALCIFGCLLQMRSCALDGEIEFVLDQFDNSTSRAGLALKYAQTAMGMDHPVRPDLFTPIPLQKHESWKTVLPLQAADYIAWEVRKFRRERKDFRPPKSVRGDRLNTHESAMAWERRNNPRYRGNFKALIMSTLLKPQHSVLDKFNLEIAHGHHPNGWV